MGPGVARRLWLANYRTIISHSQTLLSDSRGHHSTKFQGNASSNRWHTVFQSRPQWWTTWKMDISTPGAMLLTAKKVNAVNLHSNYVMSEYWPDYFFFYATFIANTTVCKSLELENDSTLQNCRHITQFNSVCATDSETVMWYSWLRGKCVFS